MEKDRITINPYTALLATFVRAAAPLAVYGFAAIGVAALLARGLALLTSTQWAYGVPSSDCFTAAQCAHWHAVQPAAINFRAAAAMESSDDSFLFILAGAVIGLTVAGITFFVRLLFTIRPVSSAVAS